MKIGAAFPSKYLKAADLDQDTRFTVKTVTVEDVGGQSDPGDTKPVVHFHETEQALVLNKTNANYIAEMYGGETDDWIGKPVVLYPTKVEFSGKLVDAIRVRYQAGTAPTSPAPQATAATPGTDAGGAGTGQAPMETAVATIASVTQLPGKNVWTFTLKDSSQKAGTTSQDIAATAETLVGQPATFAFTATPNGGWMVHDLVANGADDDIPF